MEVRIGVQNVAREIVIESEQSPEDIRTAVDSALSGNKALELKDERGRTVIVPSSVLGYVDIAAENKARVGFGG